eukprot:128416-Chlamydomonas_euryale.AAC.1
MDSERALGTKAAFSAASGLHVDAMSVADTMRKTERSPGAPSHRCYPESSKQLSRAAHPGVTLLDRRSRTSPTAAPTPPKQLSRTARPGVTLLDRRSRTSPTAAPPPPKTTLQDCPSRSHPAGSPIEDQPRRSTSPPETTLQDCPSRSNPAGPTLTEHPSRRTPAAASLQGRPSCNTLQWPSLLNAHVQVDRLSALLQELKFGGDLTIHIRGARGLFGPFSKNSRVYVL